MKLCLLFASLCLFPLSSPRAEAESLKVGVMLCQTGNCADWGTAALKGAELASEEVNLRGGVLSKKLELVVEDTAEAISGAKAATAFQNLLSKNIKHFIGPSWSPGALSIAPIASRRTDIVIITPSASAREFSRTADFIFNMRPPEEPATRSLARYAFRRGKRRAAVFSSQQPAESIQGRIFEDEFKRIGGEVVIRLEPSPTMTDLRTEALKIVKASPDVVFLMNYNQMETGAKELQTLGFNGLRVAISLDDARVRNAQGALDGIIVAKAADPSKEFRENFQKRFGELPGLSAEGGYDAVIVLTKAFQSANTFDMAQVKAALQHSRFMGAIGEFTFSPEREVVQEPILAVVEAGALKTLSEVHEGAAASPLSTERIGVIAPLTGDFSRYGERIRKGVLESGVPSERLFFEDEGCEPKKALTALSVLESIRQVHLFIGPFCGSPQIVAATQIGKSDGIAFLASSAPERVFKLSGGRMFGMQYSIEQESAFNAKALDRLGIKNVVVVLYESDFSRSHEAAFKAGYQGKILDTLVHSSADTSIIKSFALRIKQLSPAALYVPDAYPLLLGLLKELKSIGLGCMPVFSVYSAQASDVLAASNGRAESLIYSYPDIGASDAVEYFSRIAAYTLNEFAEECKSVPCILEKVKGDVRFGKSGVVAGAITLKTVRGNDFVPFDKAMERDWLESKCPR